MPAFNDDEFMGSSFPTPTVDLPGDEPAAGDMAQATGATTTDSPPNDPNVAALVALSNAMTASTQDLQQVANTASAQFNLNADHRVTVRNFAQIEDSRQAFIYLYATILSVRERVITLQPPEAAFTIPEGLS
ncbi:hypothetical protein AAF712_016819, partial [Marasmius tenuissimus]